MRRAARPRNGGRRPICERAPRALSIAKQNRRLAAILRFRSGPPLRFGCGPAPPAAFRRREGRDGRGLIDEDEDDDTQPTTPTTNPSTPLRRPRICSTNFSSTDIDPSTTNPIRDPCPEPRIATAAVADIFDALIATFADTRLEPDLDPLLWSTVNLFHRAIERIERQLDDNEQAQRRSQEDQDGSEVRSVELERLTAQGRPLIERRNALEFLRDEAAGHYERHTGSPWRPRAGSKVSHKHLDRGDDRQPRLHRRPQTRRARNSRPARTEDRRHRRRSTTTIIA